MNQTSPLRAARASCAVAAAVVCLLCLASPARAQQPDNSNSRRERTKRVTPLRTSDSQQGARVTITSDGELNDYSAYRSGDRFIVVIPQAEGGGGGAKGRGFEGAQVTRRGKDLVYTFKLEPGASARVNQRFNRLDVQFTASKSAQSGGNAATAPTPAATPRATRTPPEIAGLPSPTPDARPTPDTRVVSEAGQQSAAAQAQQQAATPGQGEGAPGFPVFNETPAAASPTTEPSVVPTVPADQIAQAQQPQQPAPGGGVLRASTEPATGATLGATLINNWPWIIAALLALGVGLLFVGRRGARRELQETPPPAAERVTPSLRETKATPAAAPFAAAATTAAVTPTTPTKPTATTPAAVPASKAAPVVPVAEPRGKKKKKKGKGKAGVVSQPAGKDETAKTVEAAETAGSAGAVEAARPEVAEAFEAKAGEVEATESAVDAARSLAPAAAAFVAAPDEGEAAEVDSERVGVEVKNLLAGESYDESVVGATDSATRQLIAAELAAALTGRNAERKERARAAFLRHGYFDDATRDLQSAEAPGRRAAAAHALSLLGDRAATSHLVAALEDPSAHVRRATVEALAELRDPAAVGPLEALRWREQSRQVPRPLIMRAVELCAESATEEADETETTLVRETETTLVRETETTLVRDERDEVTAGATPVSEAAAPAESAAPELAPAEPESKEIELVAAPAVVSDVDARPQAAAREAETFESSDTESFALSELIKGEAAAHEAEGETAVEAVTVETVVEPSLEPATATADAGAFEEARAETSAEAFVGSAAAEAVARDAEAVAAEGRAAGAVEAGAFANAAELEVEESPVSVAGEETPVVETEAAAGGEAVYTFDEDEAAAWAERRTVLRPEEEQELLAELDALEGRDAPTPTAAADERPSYVAPEYALKPEEPAAQDRTGAEAQVGRAGFEEAARAVVAEPVAPVAESFGDAPAESADEVAARTSEEAAGRAGAVKSVELFERAPAADVSAAETVAETSFAIEPFRPEEAAAEKRIERIERPAADDVRPAPAEEQPARGLAAADDDAATVLDAPRPEKGLSASLEDAGEISIIPKAIQLRLESNDSHERAQSVLALARLNTDEAFTQICAAFDDTADEVREAAARALYEVSDDRAESFTRALREAPAERRRKIGAALASSGLADDAVSQLTGESRDRTYDAFSLLFLMAKAGETAPLIKAIESHPDNEVRLAVVKLLALSGQQEVLPSFRRLAVRGSLPTDVRAAVMEAIYQISSSGTAKTPAAPNR